MKSAAEVYEDAEYYVIDGAGHGYQNPPVYIIYRAGAWQLGDIQGNPAIVAAFVAGYGAYAFIKNQFPAYMFLTSSFVFFDFGKPMIFFFQSILLSWVCLLLWRIMWRKGYRCCQGGKDSKFNIVMIELLQPAKWLRK